MGEKLVKMLDMMQTSYDIAYSLVKRQNPNFTHREIIAKRFEMMHGNEFSEEERNRIIAHLLKCA